MRIAILGIKGIPATYGGIERYTEEVAVRLAARGHDVTVYCRSYYTPREIARKRYQGVRLVRLPTLRHRVTDTLSHTALATLHAMQSRYDVVIYHSLGNALFTVAPRLVSTPSLLILHGQEWRQDKWKGSGERFFRLSERAAGRCASRVAVIAHWLREDIEHRHGWSPALVSTGVAMADPIPAEHLDEFGLTRDNYLLFVGRLVPEKEVHTLIRAYEQLHTHMPLVIVGDTQHLPDYSAKLKEMAGPNVRFLGFRYGEELATLYTNAYLYILPSSSEGIAQSLLEAMSFNDCVVVSDIPQNIEAAAPLGFTFTTGDAADLRRVLCELLDNPALVAERRTLARAHVRSRYDWDVVTDHHERLCAALVQRAKRA
ncbi:MAG TPA: glycosyltransferase family 4 protein [Ktedonobacterales bacterium]|nr:glycosyltransferase family 4 protein [Ktedonobacterales bacterium]